MLQREMGIFVGEPPKKTSSFSKRLTRKVRKLTQSRALCYTADCDDVVIAVSYLESRAKKFSVRKKIEQTFEDF